MNCINLYIKGQKWQVLTVVKFKKENMPLSSMNHHARVENR